VRACPAQDNERRIPRNAHGDGRNELSGKSQLAGILKKHEPEILADWTQSQLAASTLRSDLMTEAELREQSRQLLNALQRGAQEGQLNDVSGPQWQEARDLLTRISRSRAQQGYTPSETATFVFSLKQPCLRVCAKRSDPDVTALAETLADHNVARQAGAVHN
jgi:rsbT co-antagonist protein RsbR